MAYKNPEKQKEYMSDWYKRILECPEKLERRRSLDREYSKNRYNRIKEDPVKYEEMRQKRKEQNKLKMDSLKKNPLALEIYREENRNKSREWRKNNKDREKEISKKSRENNRENIRVRDRRDYRRRLEETPEEEKRRLRNKFLLTKYGITLENFEDMIKNQNNICMICNKSFDNNIHNLNPVVDHDHEIEKLGIMKIRGILHDECNRSLHEDIEFHRNSITYLETSRRELISPLASDFDINEDFFDYS